MVASEWLFSSGDMRAVMDGFVGVPVPDEKGRSYLDFGNDVRPNYAGKSRGVKGAAFDFRSGPIILYSAQVL